MLVKTDDYLEPLKYYESTLKDVHNDNVTNFFDELTKESKVDIEANKDTTTKYYSHKAQLDKASSKLGGVKFLIVLFWLLGIIGIVVGIILLIMGINDKQGVMIGVGVGVIVVGIVLIVLYFAIFKNKKKVLEKKVAELKSIVDQLQKEAYSQMAPLNSLFKDNMPTKLVEKSAPLFDFDDYFKDIEEERLLTQFNDKLDTNSAHSTLVVQSGHINTNPFLLRQVYEMEMRPEVYTGTLVITYTRTVSDGDGGTRTITVTQTLTATVTKPKPYYAVRTYLNYYNDGAPKLSFSRSPAGLEGKSDKELDKIAERKDKQDARQKEKAVKKGSTHVSTTNSKFEAFLNAKNADNAMEYHLLFTPLAQTNYIYNYRSTKGFGDDVYYMKNKMVNTVMSNHDVKMDYSGDLSNYYHFDYEVIKKNFIDYNNLYFASFFYDMLPIISIPLFHQHLSDKYIVERHRAENISYYEAEVLINKFDPAIFKPRNCDTNIILKPVVNSNMINVTSYGYNAVPKTEFVPVLGGDGMMHPVPVHYYDYQEVTKDTVVKYFNDDSKNLDKISSSGINYRKFKADIAE